MTFFTRLSDRIPSWTPLRVAFGLIVLALLQPGCRTIAQNVNLPSGSEDCLAIQSENVRVESDNGTYVVTDGQSRMLTAATSEDARAMAALAGRHQSHCFIGRDNQRSNRDTYIMEYWKGRSDVDVDPPPQSDCIPYDPSDLRIVDEGEDGYLLTDGDSRMVMLDDESDAEQALAWARKHDKHCFIGRDNDRPDRDAYIAEFWAGDGETDAGQRADTGQRTDARPSGPFTAVWRAGSGAQRWRSGMTFAQFKERDQTHFDNGLRLVDVDLHNGKYTAVWRAGTGAQRWRSGMTQAQFKRQDQQYFDNGLRLVDLEVEDGTYTAVWRTGSGAQRWRSGMSEDEFLSWTETYFDRGLRLRDVEKTRNGYAAVWRAGEGAQWVQVGMTQQEFTTRDQNYFDKGLRLVDVERSGGAYLGVWRAGSGAQRWRSGMSLDGLEDRDQRRFDGGLRLIDLEIEEAR